jgi:hypothetical protein
LKQLFAAFVVVIQSFVLVSVNSNTMTVDGGHADEHHNEDTQHVTESEMIAAKYEFKKKALFKKTEEDEEAAHDAGLDTTL